MKNLKKYQSIHQYAPSRAKNTKSKEFNPDDEDLSDCVSIIAKDRKENRPHRSRCFRCESYSFVNARFPYCMDCGWDSLQDPCWSDDI